MNLLCFDSCFSYAPQFHGSHMQSTPALPTHSLSDLCSGDTFLVYILRTSPPDTPRGLNLRFPKVLSPPCRKNRSDPLGWGEAESKG